MGASGSMVSGRDQNIEMNIANEMRANGHGSMQRHSSQPSTSLFSKNRQKDNTFRNTNLRSSGSFDPSTPPTTGTSEAVGIVKKEYDTLKFTKDQEIQALQRKEQKLDMENNRLRAELHALNKQFQKLRAERDNAIQSSYLATERATALEQDREKIQRQFKIFRENKENEIQTLLQAKRQLESTFHRLQAEGMATIDDHNFPGNEVAQTTHAPLEHQSGWWAAPESETTSMFGSYAQLQNGFSESVADIQETTRQAAQRSENVFNPSTLPLRTDAWLTSTTSLSNMLDTHSTYTCDNAILRCYISSTPDLLRDAQLLITSPVLKQLKVACEIEGFFLSLIHLTDMSDYSEAESKQQGFNHSNEVIQALSISSVFITFLGSTMGKYTQLELDEGYFKSSGSKSVLCCVKTTDGKSTSANHSSLIERVLSSKRCHRYSSPEEGCAAAVKEIAKSARLEFGVRVESDIESINASEVRYLDEILVDSHMERTQVEFASLCSNPKSIQPVGFEKSYDRLDEVISSPGPVPPLLVSGTRSSGKTLLLSSWASRVQANRPDVVILQHFVTNQQAVDAHPVILLRRLLSQLCRHFPNGSHSPIHSCSTYDIKRLREALPRLVEQMSSRGNKRILLVIDSVDRVQDAQRYFGWLLDPLSVGVRVVISTDVDSCPEEWRQLPTLHLEPLSIHAVKALLKEHARKRDVELTQAWERDVVSHCRTATTCHPLYVTLLSTLVCCVCDGLCADSLFHTCSKKQDSREIYNFLLRDIEAKCSNKGAKQRFKGILQFLVNSRDGLSETELMSFIPELTWHEWVHLYSKLTQLCIVREQAGVIVPHNAEAADILYTKYVGNDVNERRSRQKMISCMMRTHADHVTPRNTDLLLWMLRKEEERSTLLEVLKSPLVFHILYMSGRNSELVELWSFLNKDKDTIVRHYKDELKQYEGRSSSSVQSMLEIAKLYQSLGRFLKDLNLMEEAVSLLQTSLEIQERVLDSDHPVVADTLHYLASVYSLWGKLSTAESHYKQALEVVESTVGHDHPRVAQELSALSRIARKSGKDKESQRLHRRVTTIEQKNASASSAQCERLRLRALRLEELTLDADSIEMASALNDLGVLYYLQSNHENSESFFVRSLKMREKLLGLDHIDAAQSFHNLASVYNQRKSYPKAIECMLKALEIRRRHPDSDHSVSNSLKHLAVLYKKTKDFVRAAEVYEELLQMTIDCYGEDSDQVANALVNLAIAECQNKRFDIAHPLYKKALKIYTDTFGWESDQVSQTLKNIAILLLQEGKSQQAALVYKQSLGER